MKIVYNLKYIKKEKNYEKPNKIRKSGGGNCLKINLSVFQLSPLKDFKCHSVLDTESISVEKRPDSGSAAGVAMNGTAPSLFVRGQNFLKNVVNLEIRERVSTCHSERMRSNPADKNKKLDSINKPSPAFVVFATAQTQLLPLTKREGNKNRKELINLSTYKPIYFQKPAFTLAEVLITLGIIGVVAAMTIPNLMSKIANVKLESQFKKGHSLLAQAVKMYNSDEERVFRGTSISDFEVPDLRKYFTGTTSCDNKDAETSKYCIARTESSGGTTTVTNKDYKYTNYSRTAEYVITYSFDDNQFFLNNGMLIIVDDNSWNGNHILVTIDTNGKLAKPNALGHDVFMFELAYSDKEGGFEILPSGAPGTFYKNKNVYCSKISNERNNGLGCTYYALSDSGYFKNLP